MPTVSWKDLFNIGKYETFDFQTCPREIFSPDKTNKGFFSGCNSDSIKPMIVEKKSTLVVIFFFTVIEKITENHLSVMKTRHPPTTMIFCALQLC